MNRIRLTILLLAAVGVGMLTFGCGGDDGGPTGPGPGTADVNISILPGSSNAGANSYSPDTATIAVGQTVRWTNNDATIHTATADDGSFNTGNVGPGAQSAIITITGSPGVRHYTCVVPGHNMDGWLSVTP